MISAIYCDLDGFLADFVRGSFALHGASVPMVDVRWGFLEQIGFGGEREAEFWAPMGRSFWATLPRLADGFQVLEWLEGRVSPRKIAIVSSPCDTPGCCDGKRDWVAAHLWEHRKRAFLGSEKETLAAPCKLLLDDNDTHCEKFIAAGGRAVLIPRPWNKRRAECLVDGSFKAEQVCAELSRLLAAG